MNYGFIGCGNIAKAIIAGLVRSGYADPVSINVFDVSKQAMQNTVNTFGVKSCSGYEELIKGSNIVFIAVKPKNLINVLVNTKQDLRTSMPIVVSLCAGQTITDIETILDFPIPIVRFMPNLNASVCAGVSAYCANGHIEQELLDVVVSIFKSMGSVVAIDEADFHLFTVLASSAPAFAYLFMESLAKAALKLGMDKSLAQSIVAQTVLGSAKMLTESNEHPQQLIDKVCSPGGITIEGVTTLIERNFESTVIHAVENSHRKSKFPNR